MSQSKPAKKPVFPAQHQAQQPGIESIMQPLPVFEDPAYVGSGKLKGQVAVISGGDSGIGRAVAVAFAKEGADVAVLCLNEYTDAALTKERVEQLGRSCQIFVGDIGDPVVCRQAVEQVMQQWGRLDILINNAAEQHSQNSLLDITDEQLERTFRTNILGAFYLTREALPHMAAGGVIINTTSITAFEGDDQLIDYAATKGAIVSFTRSLSQSLVKTGIRVNAVAPGPVWTPLIPASFSAEHVEVFGSDSPMGRAGQPAELAPAYVFLASRDSAFMSGEILHVNGGTVIN